MNLRVAKTFYDFYDLRSRVTHIQKEVSQELIYIKVKAFFVGKDLTQVQ